MYPLCFRLFCKASSIFQREVFTPTVSGTSTLYTPLHVSVPTWELLRSKSTQHTWNQQSPAPKGAS